MTDSSGDRNPVELLAEEFVARKRRGEKPTLSEYTAKYPDLAGDIRDLFPALLMMEDLGDSSLASTGPHAGGAVVLEQLGDYRILREVGRGGMGVVYEAEQQSLGRRVALKVLPPHALNDGQQVRRFEREARAAARLHHTNIVPVYGVGHHEGTHYYVMQFIPGLGLDGVLEELRLLRRGKVNQPLAAAVPVARSGRQPVQQVAYSLMTGSFHGPEPSSGGVGVAAASTVTGGASDLPRLPDGSDLSSVSGSDARYWRSVARIGVQVAVALEYAHGQGILHRDVKPSNLLMDMKGTVWVTDFGLAKGGDAENLTHTGDIVGTIRYMAPERFQGHSDARSDVYSLGLTLYELIALRPAFAHRDRAKLMQQVLHEEPPRLRKVNRAVPRDLETIVQKAIAKEPGRRYARAADLAADLQRFLEDRPIRARRVKAPERFWRWCRRNPAVASLTGVVVLVTVVGFAATIAKIAEAQNERDDARQQRDKVDALNDQLRLTLYDSDMNLVQAAWELDNTPRFLELLGRQREGTTSDLRGFEWHYWQHLLGTVKVWDTAPPARAFALIDGVKPGTPFVFLLSPDASRLAVIESNGPGATNAEMRIFDSAGKQLTRTDKIGGAVRLGTLGIVGDGYYSKLAFSADGRRVVCFAPDDGTTASGLQVCDAATGRQLLKIEARKVCYGMGFSPDGGLLTAAMNASPTHLAMPVGYYQANGFKVWDAATGKELHSVVANGVVSHAFSPDGRLLAWIVKPRSGKMDCEVRVWDTTTGREMVPMRKEFDEFVRQPTFSPDGRNLAALSFGRNAKVWDAASGEDRVTLVGNFSSFTFSPDGRRIATSGSEPNRYQGDVKLWDTVTGRELLTLKTPGRCSQVVFSTDGSRLFAVKDSPLEPGDLVQVWDATPLPESLGLGIVKGEAVVQDAAGLMELARFATHKKRLFAATAGLFRDSFQAHPDWAVAGIPPQPNGLPYTNRRYAAAAAAMASAGEGDGAALTEEQRAALLLQALGWMRAELTAWEKRLAGAKPDAAAEVVRLLTDAGDDSWLAAVRDAARFAKLPAAERDEFRQLWAASARLYAKAFAIDTKLAEQLFTGHRYNAACAAALAGCGEGNDADKLDDKERARLRKQAVEWLRADLAQWTKQAGSEKPGDRALVQKALKHWQVDADLAGIRGKEALEKFPEVERDEWRNLWDEVAALLKKMEDRPK